MHRNALKYIVYLINFRNHAQLQTLCWTLDSIVSWMQQMMKKLNAEDAGRLQTQTTFNWTSTLL